LTDECTERLESDSSSIFSTPIWRNLARFLPSVRLVRK